jgi:hypothetical protein
MKLGVLAILELVKLVTIAILVNSSSFNLADGLMWSIKLYYCPYTICPNWG